MRGVCRGLVCGLGVLAAAAGVFAAGPPVEKDLGADGWVRFDGAYYDWTDADGVRAIRLWVPPGGTALRGVLFHGNPGGDGDTREIPSTESLQEFAARHGFGIAGVYRFPGREVYTATGRLILRAFELWAGLGFHPELRHAPLAPRGSSNAGVTAYALTCLAPERVICFAPNVGPSYSHAAAGQAAFRVPGLMQIGIVDPFFPDGEMVTKALFADTGRRSKVQWAWLTEEGKGHAVAHSGDLDLKFIAQCAALRLPEKPGQRGEPVALREIEFESGWWFDQESGRTGVAKIFPVRGWTNETAGLGWVPTEDMAWLCRAVATFGPAPEVEILNVEVAHNSNATGPYLREGAARVARPGDKVELRCKMPQGLEWTKTEFFDGAKKIGEAAPGGEARITWTAEAADGVAAITAQAHRKGGEPLPAKPARLVVADPNVAKRLAAHREAPNWWKPRDPVKREGGAGPVKPWDEKAARAAGGGAGALVAWALPAEEEARMAKDGASSPFWGRLTAPWQVLDTGAAREGKALDEPRMRVRAAYSKAGIYFAFEIWDNEWSAKDEVDFHIAREGTKTLYAAKPGPRYFRCAAQRSLLRSGIQYHVPVLLEEARVSAGFAEGWATMGLEWPLARAEKDFGFVADAAETKEGGRMLEWFVPWEFAGKGSAQPMPSVGTRLAAAFGYNDEGAGTPESARQIRWPGGLDAWTVPATADGPRPWGDVVIGGAAP